MTDLTIEKLTQKLQRSVCDSACTSSAEKCVLKKESLDEV